uniref:Uncharacterized protein n=1 Tax=Anguilla anguilla TaxID=7936 RepID=A0A0E9QVC7_ANGAN
MYINVYTRISASKLHRWCPLSRSRNKLQVRCSFWEGGEGSLQKSLIRILPGWDIMGNPFLWGVLSGADGQTG